MEIFSQPFWEIAIQQDGITVYTKNEKGSNFKAFKGSVIIDVDKDSILKLLKDADNYKRWYGYTNSSKLLKRDKNAQFNYVETDFPWPFKNRDMVYKMSIDTSVGGKTVVNLKGLPEFIAKKPGIVRMSKAEGYIELKSLGNETQITYVLHSEPGEGVPPLLANRSIANMPYKTLVGLRNILKN